MDVIIAARLSQKLAGKAQDSITSQDIDAREWAEDEGHNVIDTVADVAKGPSAMWDRKNLRAWVTQPELMAKYQGIVAAKQDRLSRADWRDEGDLRRWAEDNGKTLFIVDRNLRWPPRDGAHHEDDVERWNRGAEAAHGEWASTSRRYKRMHKLRASNNELSGRAIYGYRIQGINCGEIPCRCYERKLDDHKKLVIFEPEAQIVREIVKRYLAGESLQPICDDLMERGIRSPRYGNSSDKWIVSSLARLLRNPGIAGRRMNKEGKTVHRYDGVITWKQHEELVARLDSRANRKGIAPANSYMLTGITSDNLGHAMYGMKAGQHSSVYYYRCRRKGCVKVRVDEADKAVNDMVTDIFGTYPHMIRRMEPGKNHFEEIAGLRQDRNELDDLSPDYDEKHAAITAEIRRLTALDKEHPEPETVKWVFSGKSIAEHWESLSTGQRRDWLKENNWTVTVSPLPDGRQNLAIDPNGTGERSDWESVAASLGWPIEELNRAALKWDE